MSKAVRVFVAMVILAQYATALAQPAAPYPTRPVRFVIGFPAGGPTDAAGRIMAQSLSAALGQTVLIDNRPGADGVIGAELAAKATPDDQESRGTDQLCAREPRQAGGCRRKSIHGVCHGAG